MHKIFNVLCQINKCNASLFDDVHHFPVHEVHHALEALQFETIPPLKLGKALLPFEQIHVLADGIVGGAALHFNLLAAEFISGLRRLDPGQVCGPRLSDAQNARVIGWLEVTLVVIA